MSASMSASMRPAVVQFSKLAQAQPDAQPIDLESFPTSNAAFFEDFPVMSLIA